MGRMAAHRNFGIYALFHHNCERSIRGCAHFKIAGVEFCGDLIIAGASVGVAHIGLIELVIECLPIVPLAVKTA